MALVSLQGVKINFGGLPVLESIDLSIDRGERVCLVGRNGTGKSTLMGLIAREVKPDEGRIVFQQGVKITWLAQEVPRGLCGTVFDVVADAFGEQGKLLAEYHHLGSRLGQDQSGKLMTAFENAQHRLEAAGSWGIEQRVERMLSRLELSADTEFSELSGGRKRLVLLARALVSEPDLLLLDEPTNHLDIDTIAWLEEFLVSFGGTLLFVTHDRMLIRKLATRIVDPSRVGLEITRPIWYSKRPQSPRRP
jgi:ATP-binding cassette subfamily F protein uup